MGFLVFASTVYTGAMQVISGVVADIVTPETDPVPTDTPTETTKKRVRDNQND